MQPLPSRLGTRGQELVLRDAPVSKTTATYDVWTDLDMSAADGTDTAKFAVFTVRISIDTTLEGAVFKEAQIRFRKNGSATSQARMNRAACGAGQQSSVIVTQSTTIVVELDGAQLCEYFLTMTSGNNSNVTVEVDLIGYIK